MSTLIATAEGEPVLVDEGDAGSEESCVGESSVCRLEELVEGIGLSLPVGPFPRGGRLEGGRFSAARK